MYLGNRLRPSHTVPTGLCGSTTPSMCRRTVWVLVWASNSLHKFQIHNSLVIERANKINFEISKLVKKKKTEEPRHERVTAHITGIAFICITATLIPLGLLIKYVVNRLATVELRETGWV